MTAPVVVEHRQVVEAGGGIGVTETKCFFVNGEGAAEQRLGLGVTGLAVIERR
jgi:hypothetical protein